MLRTYIITALSLLCAVFVFSQSFTPNREKFAKEFEKSLAEYGKGEYHDFAKKVLPESLLESSDFTDKVFNKLIETANTMLTKKLSPYPEIYNYVFSVYSLVHAKQSETSFYAWHASVDKMLDSKNIKKFEDFIELSATFFSKRIIAESSNFTWYYEGGGYSFEYTDKAFLKFENGNLICRVMNRHSNNDDQPFLDSIHVAGTSGIFDPFLKKFVGKGGIITWEKVGLAKTETYAEIGAYDLNCKMSTLNVDSVTLTTPYFNRKIKGSLSERAFTINREEDRVFPHFISFEKRLRIKDIRPDVDYDGGFALQGASFVGNGTAEEPARLLLYRNGKVFIKTGAQTVYIYPRKFSCNHASVVMYLNTGDSISHPGLHFGYDLDKKLIEFMRSDDPTGQAPFQDSYHNLDCYVDKLTWNTDQQELFWTYNFGTSQEQRFASFESKSYFDLKLYERLQALDKIHPLVALLSKSDEIGKTIITEGHAASALNRTIEQARPLLYELASYGFIGYDTDAKTITINRKLIHFVNSKSQKTDYDNLIFNCDYRPKELEGYTEQQIKDDKNLQRMIEVYERNAEERRMMTYFGKMNLGTLELNLNGVDMVGISEMQQTLVFPAGHKVTVRQNRNFEFAGWINSGKMEMNTLSALYNYKDNKFHLMKTDKTIFRVRPLRPEDGKKLIATQGAINGIVGELLVDDPSNRSGNNKAISIYPKLIITKQCYVYYNSSKILRGAYDSTRFYYVVTPFDLDSLDNFDEKSFRLRGELVSAGIFPKITTDLTIMPDYSFGFSTSTPPGGLDFYGTNALYDNKIVLSNNGLQGEGTIKFVESTSIAKLLYFLPDSAIGYAKFNNNPKETGVEFPDVECKEAYVVYMPKAKLLKASSTPNYELRYFKGEAKLRGTLTIRATGMNGEGTFAFKTATTYSKNYRFTRWDIKADTCSFGLKNTYAEPGENAIAFSADDVQADISFKDRNGEFKNNKGSSQVNFPVNQYMCRMDKFSWFMDYAELHLDKSGEKDITIETDMDMVGPNFYSLHPKQDSLSFRVPKAKYDLRERSIYCDMVEYLDVADARIFPDSMKLIIRKNAKIEPLKRAKVTANYITQFHNFTECDLEILARMNYRGKGIYPYYDADSNLTNFYMESIFVDTTQQTEARGKIAEDAKFQLSPQFDYYGDIIVKASVQTIIFNGATRVNHTCEKFPKTWIKFSAELDPTNIQIPVESNMQDYQGKAIYSGLAWRNSMQLDSIKVYPMFLSELVRPDDPKVMDVSGFLQYNHDAKEFQIASREKLMNRSEKGDFLALHTETCSLHGEGNISLGLDLGEVKIDAVGIADYNQETNKTSMNLTLRYDMVLDEGAMEDVAERIAEVPELKNMDIAATTLEQALVEWTDQETADKVKSDYTINGEMKKLPDEMKKTIVLTGLKLTSFDKSMNQEKGLISAAETAVLLSMYDQTVVKYIPVRTFFQQIYSEAGTDKFALQIDIPGGRDYYFDYSMTKKDGDLKIISGDAEFCSAINGIKEDKRKSKNFKYEISTQRVYLSKFLRLFGI